MPHPFGSLGQQLQGLEHDRVQELELSVLVAYRGEGRRT
jgi:hypothetical protein